MRSPTLITILILLALANVFYWFSGDRLTFYLETGFLPFSDNYSAVYMSGGNVFVGRITGVSSRVLKLSNTFLVQIPKTDQASGSSETIQLRDGSLSNLALLRWGFYQPLKSQGTLLVSRDAVLFLEKLDNDSEVVRQIRLNNNQP